MMTNHDSAPDTAMTGAIERALRQIPPAWPLDSSVAVNPFLGQASEPLDHAATRLARIAGLSITPQRGWYRDQFASGAMTRDDIEKAAQMSGSNLSTQTLIAALERDATVPAPLPMVSDLAGEAVGTDWSSLAIERISAWASSLFDTGQALWVLPEDRSAWIDWRRYASHDLTPEIFGLAGFAARADAAPSNADVFIADALGELGVPEAGLENYCHQLLFSLGGWAQLARYRLWQAELKGGIDTTLRDLLAIRLFWELALLRHAGDAIAQTWAETASQHAAPLQITEDTTIDAILQTAAELGSQRALQARLSEPAPAFRQQRPALQAAFCIDVRSEVYRRALESVDPSIETIGFAGFFGLATAHRSFASDTVENRLPVLLNPGVHSVSGTDADKQADLDSRYRARAVRAWGRFKLAAVSSFAFVESAGPFYLVKLLSDGLGLKANKSRSDPAPRLEPALALEARIDAGETILRAMSLTQDFAKIVLIAGHGANVVNNPHASALHCGACGGYSGEVNARLLAGLLNCNDVREGLASRGITIPPDTVFLAGLHDTTTDAVALYIDDIDAAKHCPDIDTLRGWLGTAGQRARAERVGRLPNARKESAIHRRSRDWSEIRPEWGLAGCSAFIAAPRARTAGKGLSGRAFLHNYDWRGDDGFKVLELILTAPVVVASWISLQYYGSTVAPQSFGAGNKLLHNVVGGIGVLEGNGGPLRVGLPWQSVSDGEELVHAPLRLSVCVEAPCEAISWVLENHPEVRELFENGWLHLFAMDEAGTLAWRYRKDLDWEAVSAPLKTRETIAA
jgi:uncharacterized protein